MTLNYILQLTIASAPYKDRKELKIKIPKEKWTEFIELNSDIFTWHENTSQGKSRLENIEKYPEPFKVKMRKILNKTQAMAWYSVETGKHDFIVEHIDEYGTISTTFEKKITVEHLKVLIEMARFLNGVLLNHGSDVIDELTIK